MDFFRNYIKYRMKGQRIVFMRTPRVPESFGFTKENCPKTHLCLSVSAIYELNKLKMILDDLEELGFSVDAEKVKKEMDERILDEYKLYRRYDGFIEWEPIDEDGNPTSSPYVKLNGGVNWDRVMREELEEELYPVDDEDDLI